MTDIKFYLVNSEGCVMTEVWTDTFRNARGTFAASYSGKYKVAWIDKYSNNNERNVKL